MAPWNRAWWDLIYKGGTRRSRISNFRCKVALWLIGRRRMCRLLVWVLWDPISRISRVRRVRRPGFMILLVTRGVFGIGIVTWVLSLTLRFILTSIRLWRVLIRIGVGVCVLLVSLRLSVGRITRLIVRIRVVILVP